MIGVNGFAEWVNPPTHVNEHRRTNSEYYRGIFAIVELWQ